MNTKTVPSFDPDAPAAVGSLFGLPFTVDNAKVVALPIPWDATVSYRTGASKGPQAILNASCQVDLFDEDIPDAWKIGIAMDKFPKDFEKLNSALRKRVEVYLDAFVDGKADTKTMKAVRDEVNKKCNELRKWIKGRALHFLGKNKIIALIGGDHSTPLGLMQAVSERYDSFGILHIDAHCDLRNAYEGFTFSHASIMFNALKIKNMERLVQVGIRDFSEGEKKIIDESKGRIRLFSDKAMKKKMFQKIFISVLI
jgi:agmatinase